MKIMPFQRSARVVYAATARPDSAVAAPWRWAISGALLGLLGTLLACAPAPWLAYGLAQVTHSQLQLHEARGTVWHGTARVVLTGGAGSRDALALPGRISWTLRSVLSDAQLGLQLVLQSDCCMPHAMQVQVSPSLRGVHVRMTDTPSTWPAALLSGLGAPWNTLQPEGDLTIAPQQLTLQWLSGRFMVQGGVTVTAKDMSSRLSPLKPMGSYQVNLDAGNTPTATPNLKLSTLSGSLLLTGQGQWIGPRLRFQGEASATPEHAAALNNLLNIIGRRQGERSLLSWG